MASTVQVKQFIEQIAPIVQKYAKQYGYMVVSPVIAQACCESAFGTSSLGYKYHNYFGLKCGSSWKGASVNLSTKEEYKVGTLTNIKANFRAYDTMDAGVKGYFDFISATRYANLKTANTPTQYLEFIKADGYATSSTYVNTNMNIVKKYNLTKYDDLSEETSLIDNGYKYVIGRNYTLQNNMYVRDGANGNKKKYAALSTNSKSNAYKDGLDYGILKKGTVVTVKEVQVVNGTTWIKIPSGWICGISESKTVYVK